VKGRIELSRVEVGCDQVDDLRTADRTVTAGAVRMVGAQPSQDPGAILRRDYSFRRYVSF